MNRHVTLVVSPSCASSDRGRALADELRRLRPDRPVVVVDLGAHGGELPDGVVGTPTWLLDGEVAFLGNPPLEELLATLDTRTPA